VFGLCHLLGLRFAPRLRDLSERRLYIVDRRADYGALDCLIECMSVAGVAAMPVASGESLPTVPSMFAPLTHDRPSDPMRLSLWWVAPWEDVPASA
jgi:hypothetical protein